MRIAIIGAGKTGEFLAQMLHEDHDIVVLETRPDRVEEVSRRLPDVDVIEGDACEPTVLERAGIREVDLVAAVTGDDEDNLVVAMLAKLFEVKTVFCRVNHPQNEWLYDKEWGVDVAVSSPAILYGLIEKQVGFGDLITLLKLQGDGIAIEEITLPPTATLISHQLSEVPLPANVQVMAIIAAEGYVQIARGNTVLVEGDQLLLLVEGEPDKEAIRIAFGIPEEDAPTAPRH